MTNPAKHKKFSSKSEQINKKQSNQSNVGLWNWLKKTGLFVKQLEEAKAIKKTEKAHPEKGAAVNLHWVTVGDPIEQLPKHKNCLKTNMTSEIRLH